MAKQIINAKKLMIEITFNSWYLYTALIAFFLAIHPYTTYPASLFIANKMLRNRKINSNKNHQPKTSIVFCCYNEEKSIHKKIENMRQLLKRNPELEILVYADGCSDNTLPILQKNSDILKVFHSDQRKGKASGMNILLENATGEVVVFTDANVMLDENAPAIAAGYFADETIGCICGNLIYTNDDSSPTAGAGGLYWRLEELIKGLESKTGSTMGADGSLFAIRRELFQTVPADMIDDFFTSMSILCKGYRLVKAEDFIAYEKSATKSKDEFLRKIRISCRAFNCNRKIWKKILKMPAFDIYKYISHKLLRWLTAPLLVAAIIFTILFFQYNTPFEWLGYYILGIGSITLIIGHKMNIKYISVLTEILLAFIATFLGVIQSLRGKKYQTWQIAQSSR